MQDLFKAQLSSRRRQLVEIFQKVNFGSIENLRVSGGEPYFEPYPTIFRDIKFGSSVENGPRPELGKANFRLKAQLLELFEVLDHLQDGVIRLVEIKNGLPFRIVVQEPAHV